MSAIDASTITDPAAIRSNSRRRRTNCRACWAICWRSARIIRELKSNQNFLALQAQLEGTENRIEIARRDYNSAVQDYNTELVTIPGSLWAATLYKSLQAGDALRRQRRGADRAGGELPRRDIARRARGTRRLLPHDPACKP